MREEERVRLHLSVFRVMDRLKCCGIQLSDCHCSRDTKRERMDWRERVEKERDGRMGVSVPLCGERERMERGVDGWVSLPRVREWRERWMDGKMCPWPLATKKYLFISKWETGSFRV